MNLAPSLSRPVAGAAHTPGLRIVRASSFPAPTYVGIERRKAGGSPSSRAGSATLQKARAAPPSTKPRAKEGQQKQGGSWLFTTYTARAQCAARWLIVRALAIPVRQLLAGVARREYRAGRNAAGQALWDVPWVSRQLPCRGQLGHRLAFCRYMMSTIQNIHNVRARPAGRVLFHGVHHVALLCEDLDRSLEFYCGVLGAGAGSICCSSPTLSTSV